MTAITSDTLIQITKENVDILNHNMDKDDVESPAIIKM